MAWEQFRHRDFTGGENKKLLPEGIAPNQVDSAVNCIINADGTLSTRDGKTRINTTSLGAGPILGIWRFSKESGSQYLVAQHGTSLYASTWDGVNQIASFGAAIKTGLTAATKLRGCVWKNRLFLTNGIDNFFSYNGTTCTDVPGAPPKFRNITVYGGRIWGIRADMPNVVQFSGLENPDTWDALDIIKVGDGDGDEITALAPQRNGLMILKRTAIYPMFGRSLADIQLMEPLTTQAGCVSVDGCITDGLFLGKDNIYRFDMETVNPLSQTHSGYISALPISLKQTAIFGIDPLNRRAVLSLGTGFDEALAIHADYGGAITTWQGLGANCFAVASDKNDAGFMLFGDKTNGIIYRQAGADDDGTTITTLIKTSYQDYNVLEKKHFRCFETDMEIFNDVNYNVNFKVDVDFDRDSRGTTEIGVLAQGSFQEWGDAEWGQSYWGAPQNSLNKKFFFHALTGRRAAFTVTTNNRIRYMGHIVTYRRLNQWAN
jgi:hypothetical protein